MSCSLSAECPWPQLTLDLAEVPSSATDFALRTSLSRRFPPVSTWLPRFDPFRARAVHVALVRQPPWDSGHAYEKFLRGRVTGLLKGYIWAVKNSLPANLENPLFKGSLAGPALLFEICVHEYMCMIKKKKRALYVKSLNK